MATNKWNTEVTLDGEKMTAEAAAVSMYKGGKTPDEIADFLGEEFHGSQSKGRKVISKLSHLKVYEKPEAEAKAERTPQIVKADLIANIEAAVEGFELGTLSRGNTADLIRLAEHFGADIPEPR